VATLDSQRCVNTNAMNLRKQLADLLVWQLVEHMRLVQTDILEFCVNRHYEEKQWPKDFWPSSAKPPNRRAWNGSIARFKKDRRALGQLIAVRRLLGCWP